MTQMTMTRARGQKNRPPADIWETLMRLRACNKTQLAEALGVSPRTLRYWMQATEAGESAGKSAAMHASDLLQATLRAASADVYALPINWEAVRTIGGKR